MVLVQKFSLTAFALHDGKCVCGGGRVCVGGGGHVRACVCVVCVCGGGGACACARMCVCGVWCALKYLSFLDSIHSQLCMCKCMALLYQHYTCYSVRSRYLSHTIPSPVIIRIG